MHSFHAGVDLVGSCAGIEIKEDSLCSGCSAFLHEAGDVEKIKCWCRKKAFCALCAQEKVKQRLFQRQLAVKLGTSFAFAYSYLENCPKFVLLYYPPIKGPLSLA